jgi:hypothetical protein
MATAAAVAQTHATLIPVRPCEDPQHRVSVTPCSDVELAVDSCRELARDT